MGYILLCIADEKYNIKYERNIKSHLKYCELNKIEYKNIYESSALNPYWQKIAIALTLLVDGYNVMVIDADAEIINLVHFGLLLNKNPQHDIFMALGNSGRVNSGVMLLRSSEISKSFLEKVLNNRGTPPPEDFVTAVGENGHIINILKLPMYKKKLYLLNRLYNCTHPDCYNDAYIRHYTNKLKSYYFLQTDKILGIKK